MKNNKILKSIIVVESVCVIGMSMLLSGCAKESNIKDNVDLYSNNVNHKVVEPAKELNVNKEIETKVETTVEKEPVKNTIKENAINKKPVNKNESVGAGANDTSSSNNKDMFNDDREVQIDTSIEDIESMIDNIEINTDDIPLEVIKEYYKYKEELINEYGEDTYNLMNIEAGIESEEQSLKHFIEYGI